MRFRYQDLIVGEMVADFVDLIYKITKEFPAEERFELVRQMRRAVTSIYLNLAEGTARKSKKDFARFITIAQGSLVEVHACANLAKRRKYINPVIFQNIDQVSEKIWIKLSALHSSQIRHKG